ncbi:MAG: ADP-ribosylglycohydrolase family protein, partial [Candidatus Dormibacteraeota bacterium]|nr:ADP-ribosylglycohydrolase family protein [Candidatus Dormibacteraeota bacterium]
MRGERRRALGALYGLALGDALGMPTQELTRATALRILGPEPRLLPGPAENPISAGLPAGTITDDTEQALIIARLLLEGEGRVRPERLARELVALERRFSAAGRRDLLGPSTGRAVAAISRGEDPRRTGRAGVTNGAAMRVAPLGIAVPPTPPSRLVAAVVAAGRPTHDTGP